MKKLYTEKQGQYLAFIYYYTKMNGRAPAETDMERYFRVTPPSVHQMVLTLEANGLIDRTPAKGVRSGFASRASNCRISSNEVDPRPRH